MGYYNRRNSWGGRRGMRRMQGFIWMLVFIFMFASHSWIGFMFGIGFIILMSIILRAIMAAVFSSGMMGTMLTNQPPQARQPEPQQDYAQVYQPYEPYEQGYQPAERPYQSSQIQPQYEEPQIQYPQEQGQGQELPPMEQ